MLYFGYVLQTQMVARLGAPPASTTTFADDSEATAACPVSPSPTSKTQQGPYTVSRSELPALTAESEQKPADPVAAAQLRQAARQAEERQRTEMLDRLKDEARQEREWSRQARQATAQNTAQNHPHSLPPAADLPPRVPTRLPPSDVVPRPAATAASPPSVGVVGAAAPSDGPHGFDWEGLISQAERYVSGTAGPMPLVTAGRGPEPDAYETDWDSDDDVVPRPAATAASPPSVGVVGAASQLRDAARVAEEKQRAEMMNRLREEARKERCGIFFQINWVV